MLRDAPGEGDVPAAARILAPVDLQEIWAAGVTYERSRSARVEESQQGSVYDQVYVADRPEFFFKAAAWRVRGPGETVGIRADSAWNVPEPELSLVVAADLRIAGYTIGNVCRAVRSRARTRSTCPRPRSTTNHARWAPLVPRDAISLPIELRLSILRGGVAAFEGETTTARIWHHRDRPLTSRPRARTAGPDPPGAAGSGRDQPKSLRTPSVSSTFA